MPRVTRIQRKDFISDLDEIAREGARQMLAEALEAEVVDYIARNQERDEDGCAKVVRNGEARPRKVTLGSGTVEVRAPRIDDRRHGEEGRHHRFHSQILPPYMRRSPKVAEVLPILYLRGLSTGDFKEGLAALLSSSWQWPSGAGGESTVHISSQLCGLGFSSATAFDRKGEMPPDAEPGQSPHRANRRIGCRIRSVSACWRRLPIGATS